MVPRPSRTWWTYSRSEWRDRQALGALRRAGGAFVVSGACVQLRRSPPTSRTRSVTVTLVPFKPHPLPHDPLPRSNSVLRATSDRISKRRGSKSKLSVWPVVGCRNSMTHGESRLRDTRVRPNGLWFQALPPPKQCCLSSVASITDACAATQLMSWDAKYWRRETCTI